MSILYNKDMTRWSIKQSLINLYIQPLCMIYISKYQGDNRFVYKIYFSIFSVDSTNITQPHPSKYWISKNRKFVQIFCQTFENHRSHGPTKLQLYLTNYIKLSCLVIEILSSQNCGPHQIWSQDSELRLSSIGSCRNKMLAMPRLRYNLYLFGLFLLIFYFSFIVHSTHPHPESGRTGRMQYFLSY